VRLLTSINNYFGSIILYLTCAGQRDGRITRAEVGRIIKLSRFPSLLLGPSAFFSILVARDWLPMFPARSSLHLPCACSPPDASCRPARADCGLMCDRLCVFAATSDFTEGTTAFIGLIVCGTLLPLCVCCVVGVVCGWNSSSMLSETASDWPVTLNGPQNASNNSL
jgi:hypothetical protein